MRIPPDVNKIDGSLENMSLNAYHNLFGEVEINYKSDEEYLGLLKEFENCANAGLEAKCFELYRDLIVGTEKQLAKLGYVLAKGKYLVGGIYEKFDYPRRQSGEPYAPVYLYNRYDWVSLLKVNLDCFDEESPRIGFSTDIYSSPEAVKWLEKCGKMTYKSGSFGWLHEIKHCFIMKVNKNLTYDAQLLESMPFDSEYKSKLHQSNDAFFTEDGEKEYSVEICQLTKDNEIVILCRYTIDGADQGDRPSKAVPIKLEI